MKTGSVVQIGGAVRHNPLPPLTPFYEPSLVDVTGERSCNFKNVQTSSLGGFIGGGQLAWRANGPTIEVLDPFNCTRLAAWTFGAILHNTSAKITCVCSIGVGNVTHVVVGIDLGEDCNPQGMVGVLSLRRSRITRAFQFRHKVTNVCMVTGGDKLVDLSTLSPELRPCQGLLAVATGHSFLFLVDLALDLGANKITSDEVSPAAFVDISIPDAHADIKRNEAVAREYHPMLCLSENFSSGGYFTLLGPDDNILFEAPSHTVEITTLLYIPQLASLVVGYSFGSFQIINLSIITVDCASPYEVNLPPVFSFAYQEPENDPRSFVYLWVCRSLPLVAEKDKSKSEALKVGLFDKATCSLYAMNYEKKEWIEGYGLWYQGLQTMSPRFEFDATGGIGQQSMSLKPSKIFSAMTVVGVTPTLASPLNSGAAYMIVPSDEESDPVPELSLCTFCWEGKFLDHGREVMQHYIAIFDINQWYQAQMPSHLRLQEDTLCPFMSFHIMDKVPKSVNEKILSAAPKISSWSRHSSKSHCENDWYPSSLSYDFHLLTSEGLVTYRCPSVQQTAISELTQLGPGAIVNPHTVYNTCLFAGIIHPETTVICSGSTIVTEREQLLNIALEYHLLSLIVQCIVEFSEGRFAHVGCSLQLLLDWAWNKIRTIKESYDTLCVSLFSFSEASILSDAGLVMLHQNLTYLSHLNTIVKTIKDNAGDVTIISAGELEGRVQVVQLLELHLQAILWFYHSGLLPQCNQDDQLDGKSVPFPAKALRNIYNQRRSDIKNLNSQLNSNELLLIDCMLEESGSLLLEIWSEEGREDAKTIYPPPSLHSLLNMYLLPGMTTATKHRIIQYLFLDLVSLLSDNYLSVVEEFVKFPASVSMSPSINKLTQAFWLIDQKDFETGLSVLLDPLVNPSDITPRQHQRIIKAFLFQGEEAHALSYIQLRNPPERNMEDIQINLSVLLANGRIREAFHYQRKRRVSSNIKELLQHFFTACEHLGRLESIVHLPLSPIEEESFVNYLHASCHPAAQDILLVYYLQQSRFGEISKLHDGVKDSCNSTYYGQKTRNALIQGYLSHLPDVRSQTVSMQNPKNSRVMFSKPQPLSARIRQSASSSSPISTKTKVLLQNIHSNDKSAASTSHSILYTPFRSKIQRRKAIKDWKEEVGLINKSAGPSGTELRIQRKASHIVFPTLQEDSESVKDTSTLIVLSSAKLDVPCLSKQRSTVMNIPSLKEDVSRTMEEVLRKSYRTNETIENISKSSKISSEVIDLLKTPPVHRKSNNHVLINESLSDTPQSILKVRKILQRSQSPSDMESLVPSFPLHRSITKNFREKSSEKSVNGSESGSLTPKQLRFDLPSRKLSVDENNSIIFESSEVVKPLVLETSTKRKRSDDSQSSSSDIPTPRKPLPKFVDGKAKLSFGIRSESDIEEELNPVQSVAFTCSKVTKVANTDLVIRETTETRIESKSTTNTKNSIGPGLEAISTLNSVNVENRSNISSFELNVTDMKVSQVPTKVHNCENEPDLLISNDNVAVKDLSDENKDPLPKGKNSSDIFGSNNSDINLQSITADISLENLLNNKAQSTNSNETITDTSKVQSLEVLPSPRKKCSKNSTVRLNMKEAKKLLNHVHESFRKSPRQNENSFHSGSRDDGKEAVKCFLNGIFGSDNHKLNNEVVTVGKVVGSQNYLYSPLPKANNSDKSINSFVNDEISHNCEAISAVQAKVSVVNSSFYDRNMEESKELSTRSLELISYIPQISSSACVQSDHIVEISKAVVANDDPLYKHIENKKGIVSKQIMSISMESIDDMFENAVETLSHTENSDDVSQLSINTCSVVNKSKITNELLASSDQHNPVTALPVTESNLQCATEETVTNDCVSISNCKDDADNISSFSESAGHCIHNLVSAYSTNEGKDLNNSIAKLNPLLPSLIDSESIQGSSRINNASNLGISPKLENTFNIPMYLIDKENHISKSDLNDYLLPHTELSKDTDLPELKADDDSCISVIAFSEDDNEDISLGKDHVMEASKTEVTQSNVIAPHTLPTSNFSLPSTKLFDEENEVTSTVVDFELIGSEKLSYGSSCMPSVTNSEIEVPEFEPCKVNCDSQSNSSYIPVIEFSDEENESTADDVIENTINKDYLNDVSVSHHKSNEVEVSHSETGNIDQPLQLVDKSYIPVTGFSGVESNDSVTNIVIDHNINEYNASLTLCDKLNDADINQSETHYMQATNEVFIAVNDFSEENNEAPIDKIIVDNKINKENDSSLVLQAKLSATEVTHSEIDLEQSYQTANSSFIPVVEFSDDESEDGYTLSNNDVNKKSNDNAILSEIQLSVPVGDQFESCKSDPKLKNECTSFITNSIEPILEDNKDDSIVASRKASEINSEIQPTNFLISHMENTEVRFLQDKTDLKIVTECSNNTKSNLKENAYDGYHSDDSAKTVEFDINLIDTAVKESFRPLPVVPKVFNEGDESVLMETSLDNNNISKINSFKLSENLTPSRRKKTFKGLDTNLIGDSTPVSAPSTPLRRSRRLSSSTPTKIYETPKRRQRRPSETSDIEDGDEFLIDEVLTVPSSNSVSKITPSKANKQIEELATSGDLLVKEIILSSTTAQCLERTPLKLGKETDLPSTPLSTLKSQRVKKINTSPRIDTPIRRSSRLNVSFDALRTIVEENKMDVIKTPLKKTPLRSKRKSIAPNVESILETIKEDSELKDTDIVDSKCINRLSPLETASTTTVIRMRRGQSLEPETPKSSLRRSQRGLPKGRRKSASVSPELLCNSFGERHNSVESGESKENEDLRSHHSIDQTTHDIIELASNDDLLHPMAMTILTKNTSNRQSYSRRKSSMTFSLPKNIDASFELPVSRKTYNRKSSVLSSTILKIRTKDAEQISTNDETLLKSYENGPSQVLEAIKENGPLLEEISPVVTYNLLEAPEKSHKLGILRASSNTNIGSRKRKQSTGRGITSLSVPADADDNNIDIVPPKRQRKSSISKKITAKSSTSKDDVNSLRTLPNSDEEGKSHLITENDPSITSSVSQKKSGNRKADKKR